MSTVRFCPCCAGKWCDYTVWHVNGIRATCENNMWSNHLCYVSRGVYCFYIGGLGLSCGCSYGKADDEAIRCDHVWPIYPRSHASMVAAMEAEVKSGTYEAYKWAPTFPQRAARAEARRRAVVVAALEGKLLAPLCAVVMGYMG